MTSDPRVRGSAPRWVESLIGVPGTLPAAEATAWRTELAVQRARCIALALATGVTLSLRGPTLDPRWLVVLLLAGTVALVAVGLRNVRGRRGLRRLGSAAFAADAGAIALALWVVNTNPADPIWAITGLLAIEAAARWGARGAVAGGLLSAAMAGWWATMAYAAEDRDLSVESLIFRGVVLIVLALPAGRLIDQLRREQERARQLYEASTELIVVLDAQDRVVSANPAAVRLLGRPAALLRELTIGELLPGLPPIIQLLAMTASNEEQLVTLPAEHGPPRILAVTVRRTGDQSLVHLIGRDVTAEHSREAQLRYQALHDVLTGLPNRTALQERLDGQLASDDGFGLLFVDLDGFKAINDTYGHGVGDQVLERIARRLRRAVRDSDAAYRLAGDEFCVVVTPTDSAGLQRVANRVAAALAGTMEVEGRQIATSASVGISLARAGDDRDQLLARADAAMYAVKSERSTQPSTAPGTLGASGTSAAAC